MKGLAGTCLIIWWLHITKLFHIFLVSSVPGIQNSWVRLQNIMKPYLIMINFYCLFYLPFDFWMHSITFSSFTLQPHKRLLFLNESISETSWLIIHHTTFLTASNIHFRDLSYLFFVVVVFSLECDGKSLRQITSLTRLRIFPTFLMLPKSPFGAISRRKKKRLIGGNLYIRWQRNNYI